MKIAVIGAGLVGLASAHALADEGHEVTVVDREGPAAGASRGNAGWLAHTDIDPIASPKMLRQVPKLPPGSAGAARDPAQLPAADPALAARGWSGLAPGEPRTFSRGAGGSAAARHAGLGQAVGRSRADSASSTTAAGSSCSTTRRPSTAAKPHFEKQRAWASRAMLSDAAEIAADGAGPLRADRRRPRSSPTRRMSPIPALVTRGAVRRRHDARRELRAGRRRRGRGRPARAHGCSGRRRARRRRASCSPPAPGRSRSLPASATTCRLRPSAATMSAFPASRRSSTRPVSFHGHGFVATPLDTGLRIGGAVELARAEPAAQPRAHPRSSRQGHAFPARPARL